MTRSRVLLVDDEELIRFALTDSLTGEGLEVCAVGSGAEALAQVSEADFDVAVLDLQLPDMSGLDVLRHVRDRRAATDVVMITAHGSIPTAVEAMKLGARDFLTKPFKTEQLLSVIRRYLRVQQARQSASDASTAGRAGWGMVGRSAPMLELFRVIEAVAEGTATILVRGETGTGKELVANAIHRLSPRGQGPLVKVNCASIPEQLFESELYGTERGAFTGAHQRRRGRFELADGGTLFLDEVDEMPLLMQAKLLRSIQEKEIDRLGGSGPTRVDVRVVAATKVDLCKRVEQGAFREDLYYRLNVLPVTLPPLRERNGDVALLAEHFLAREAEQQARGMFELSDEARNVLMHHGFPGNVRELQNIVARAVALCGGEPIQVRHLGLERSAAEQNAIPLSQSVEDAEYRRIDEALAAAGGRKTEAAARLGISRKTLWEKLKRRRDRQS